MNKILKIGGLVLGALIVCFGLFTIFDSFNGNKFSPTEVVAPSVAIDEVGAPSSLSKNSSVGVATSADYAASGGGRMVGAPLAVAPEPSPAPVEKKIVKNGNLNLKINAVDEAVVKITEIAKNEGGEIFASNFYQSSKNVKSGVLTVKVPVANFEKTFAEIKSVANLVIRESTAGQDVTQEYTDLKAQLVNSQAEEQSFLKILAQAQKIDDVLAVTREVSRVRGEIEQLQGSIKYLESQTDMSVISVSLTEDANITVADSWRPIQVAKEAVNLLLKDLQNFVDFVIRLLIVGLPLLLLWAVLLGAVYLAGKKIFFKIQNNQKNK
jgi:hypothetical protein